MNHDLNHDNAAKRRPAALLAGGLIMLAVAGLMLWAYAAWRVPGGEAADATIAGGGTLVLGRSDTPFDPDQYNRNENLSNAVKELDGTVVEPGAEFSFNQVVGERDEERGYRAARVIIDGRNESGIAGGICQVSSTVYNAALLAGMEIVERHPHSRPVPYIDAGLDATVSYGARDLRWINTRDAAVVVRAAVSGTRVSVWIEGPGPAPRIRLYTETIEVVPPKPMAPPDPTGRSTSPPMPDARTIAGQGSPGYRVRVWAEEPTDDGGRVRRLVSTDLYEPVNASVK